MAVQERLEQKTRKEMPRREPEPARPEAESEPIAQWRDVLADRWLYLFWMACFAAILLHVIIDTATGLMRLK